MSRSEILTRIEALLRHPNPVATYGQSYINRVLLQAALQSLRDHQPLLAEAQQLADASNLASIAVQPR